MNVLTLRIKKKYFDQILDGSKKYEYRADKPFYSKLETTNYTHVLLHYQGTRQVMCSIVKIEKIKNPLTGAELELVPSKWVYRIELKNPKLLFL